MSVLRWMIPSFITDLDDAQDSLFITIENRFVTAYDEMHNSGEKWGDEQPEDIKRRWGGALRDQEMYDVRESVETNEDYRQRRDDQRYLEWYFGRVVADIYYALYERSFLMDSDTAPDSEQLFLLNEVCNEIENYTFRARKIIERIDQISQGLAFPRESGIGVEGFIENKKAQKDLTRFLLRLGKATRGRIDSETITRSAAIRSELHRMSEEYSFSDCYWWRNFERLSGAILDDLAHAEKGAARRQYRQLYLSMGYFYIARVESVVQIKKEFDGRKRFTPERKLHYAIDDEAYQELYFDLRGLKLEQLEQRFKDCFQHPALLSVDDANEKIETLRALTQAEVTPLTHEGDLYEKYMNEEAMDEGPCFAILHIDGQPKDIAVLSGCLDGEGDEGRKIADQFHYACGEDDKYAPYNSFNASLTSLIASPGFQKQFELARTNKEVRYCFRNSITQQMNSITLEEFMNAMLPHRNAYRMFSCCERKLFSYLQQKQRHSQGVSPRYSLIIRRKVCEICIDAFEYYESQGLAMEVVERAYQVCGMVEDNKKFKRAAEAVYNGASLTEKLDFSAYWD